jgi:hypothetical protein
MSQQNSFYCPFRQSYAMGRKAQAITSSEAFPGDPGDEDEGTRGDARLGLESVMNDFSQAINAPFL